MALLVQVSICFHNADRHVAGIPACISMYVICYVICVGHVYGADGARHRPHRMHDLRSGSQDHHPSKNSVQKTICCNSTSNAPDDGRMYPNHVELRIYQYSYLVA